jgi:hypothetical protein
MYSMYILHFYLQEKTGDRHRWRQLTENTTPVPRFFSLPKIHWKKRKHIFKSPQEAYAPFLLWKETVMRRTNLRTILCNLLHPTNKT